MKLNFSDKSSIEFRNNSDSNNIEIILQAKDSQNPLKTITQSLSITKEQFKQLIIDVDIS